MDKYLISLHKMSDLITHMKEREQLFQIENKIYENDKTLAKVISFQKAQDRYNDALKYNLDNKDELKKELVNAMKIMNEDNLVSQYNNLYIIVTEPTLYLEQELHKVLYVKGDKTKC